MARIAILPVTPELLVNVLGLPIDTKIQNAMFDSESRTVLFRIEQKDLQEVPDAYAIPKVKALIGLRTDLDNLVPKQEVIFQGWGQQ